MRNKISFNHNWFFSKEAMEVPTSLSSSFEMINIPHTWNNNDGQDGGNDYYRGTCFYVKEFLKNDLPQGDEYYLEFYGVNASGDVYLNNKHLAHHDGGYSTWRVNISDALEEENFLVVGVDNSKNDKVYPQMADFTFYGGIYRNVNLIAVNKTHFDLDYYGGPGIKVTPILNNDSADINVEVFPVNINNDELYRYEIFNQDNELINSIELKENKYLYSINNPHLWNGVKDPYLYHVKVSLLRDDVVLDEVCSRFGIRSYEIDPNKGFILNGKEYPLRGVSRHQDRKGFGNALLPEHHKQDMELIKEVGATTIRLAHYQHDPYFYDLCDEYGMVVWAEIPYISKHLVSANENTKSQMKELVIQNYNHPSIVVWGLSNEITIAVDDKEDLFNNHVELNKMVKELDPTRLTTMACVSMLKLDDPLLELPDVISYNHYFGWYGGDTSMNGPWLDNFHEVHPDIPIGLSEYGCEALDWHTSRPKQGDYTEEYQAYYHEELIKQIKDRPYLWATHVWNMFDFGADGRSEGGENGQNHKGLVNFDRTYKKDSFYAYKAWLSEEKFVHLCSKRYIDRVEDQTKITVYSNLDHIDVYLNDELYASQDNNAPFYYFEIPNISETKITIKSGEYVDEGMIRKVDKPNEDYILKEAGAIINWFDITEVPGHYSLNDTLGEIMKNPQGQILLGSLMGNMRPSQSNDMGFELGEETLKMMNGFTVVRLMNLMAGTLELKIDKEELLKLNEALNQIPKE